MSTVKQRFTVGKFDYELHMTSPGHVSLYLVDGWVDGLGSVRDAYREVDPLQKWGDYDPDDFGLVDDYDFNVPVFALARECVGRIHGWVNQYKPGYFKVSPSTKRKARVYDRIAKIIDRKVRKDYHHIKIKDTHHFYRKGV